jgi:hypothetical protein
MLVAPWSFAQGVVGPSEDERLPFHTPHCSVAVIIASAEAQSAWESDDHMTAVSFAELESV